MTAALLFFGMAAVAARNDAVRVELDRSTGSTLQVTVEPWVLAFEQPLLAAHARDYVALHAVQTSNGGRRHHYLAAFFWSTVPGRNRFAGPTPGLRLLLDDREVVLKPEAGPLRDAGIGKWPLRPPGRDALLVIFAVEPQLLRQLGHVRQARLRPEPDSGLPPEVWFETWRDASAAFRGFADQVLALP